MHSSKAFLHPPPLLRRWLEQSCLRLRQGPPLLEGEDGGRRQVVFGNPLPWHQLLFSPGPAVARCGRSGIVVPSAEPGPWPAAALCMFMGLLAAMRERGAGALQGSAANPEQADTGTCCEERRRPTPVIVLPGSRILEFLL